MSKTLAYLGVLCSALFWGVSFIAAKEVMQFFSVISAIAYRFIIAAVIMLIIFFITQKNYLYAIKKDFLGHIVLALLSVVAYNLFFFMGIKSTSSVNAALITTTGPVLTILIASLLGNEKLNKSHIIGFGVSFIGVIVATIPLNALSSFTINFGDILILLSTLSIAFFNNFQKKLIKYSNPITLSTTNALIGVVVFLTLHYATNQQVSDNIPINAYLSLAFLAIFATVLGFLFWINGIQKLGVANTAIFYNVVPVFAIIFAYFMGSNPSTNQIIATILVIFGVLYSTGGIKKIMILAKRK